MDIIRSLNLVFCNKKFFYIIKSYEPSLNRLIMINVLKKIGIILRTHGKESNLLFL